MAGRAVGAGRGVLVGAALGRAMGAGVGRGLLTGEPLRPGPISAGLGPTTGWLLGRMVAAGRWGASARGVPLGRGAWLGRGAALGAEGRGVALARAAGAWAQACCGCHPAKARSKMGRLRRKVGEGKVLRSG